MNTFTPAVTEMPGTVSPLDALWTLIQCQTKTIRKALAKRILDEELSARERQEAMVNRSLTKAFGELHSGKAKHDARALFTH